jgi:hypothetical protein
VITPQIAYTWLAWRIHQRYTGAYDGSSQVAEKVVNIN